MLLNADPGRTPLVSIVYFGVHRLLEDAEGGPGALFMHRIVRAMANALLPVDEFAFTEQDGGVMPGEDDGYRLYSREIIMLREARPRY